MQNWKYNKSESNSKTVRNAGEMICRIEGPAQYGRRVGADDIKSFDAPQSPSSSQPADAGRAQS